MTEAEWLACDDPVQLLDFHRARASERKLRLFGCAVVRLVWSRLEEEPPAAVGTAEGFADRSATKAALRRARQGVRKERYALEAADAGARPRWGAYWLSEVVASENACGFVFPELNQLTDVLIFDAEEWGPFAGLLRDVFGNPFRPAAFDPGRRTAPVALLARAAYDERALPSGALESDRLAVLADALEEAGCPDAAILAHLRGPGPHVRGCWVLDLILGNG